MARLPDLACPLIADRTGNVLMKWYSVLICYEVKLVSSLIRTKIGQIIGYPEKIFLFFSKRLLCSHKSTNIRHSPVSQFLQASYRHNIGKSLCAVVFQSKFPMRRKPDFENPSHPLLSESGNVPPKHPKRNRHDTSLPACNK